jgi:prepilin-type N-terminal cleavage/methylation domain-containing protein/prepilin-type processing-associated H-X9-DG protein
MKRRFAFTLVELLVVIGIIALLISILLPALSRARGQANLVDCQARLRQIGMGMHTYAALNQGVFPYSMLYHDAPHLTNSPNPYPNELWWKWHYTVSQILGTESMQNNNSYWGGNSGVFIDKDAIEGSPWGWHTDYIANPRVMTPNDTGDPVAGKTSAQTTQRRVSSIKRASEVMAVWDAPQWADYGNSSIEHASAMGGWQWYWGSYFCFPAPKENEESWVKNMYDIPIRPGAADGDGAVLQKQWNKDFGGVPWAPANAAESYASAFRFRHVNNTTLNALFVDGHVDSRKVGQVTLRDVCTNSPY